jgi:class 3 adenylate cyclase
VTVLFADVQGSMALAEQIDPEKWHGILDRFFRILSDGVHRFEGTINQYTGDGIMALFGAPIAHEDYASRGAGGVRRRDVEGAAGRPHLHRLPAQPARVDVRRGLLDTRETGGAGVDAAHVGRAPAGRRVDALHGRESPAPARLAEGRSVGEVRADTTAASEGVAAHALIAAGGIAALREAATGWK